VSTRSVNYLLGDEATQPVATHCNLESLKRATMASYRLRCGYVAENLHQKGYRVGLNANPNSDEFYEHLIVLKPPKNATRTKEWIDYIYAWKARGSKIWIDISDPVFTDSIRHQFFSQILNIGDGIITNSRLMRLRLHRRVQLPIFNIPDPVEFQPHYPHSIPSQPKKFLWFGHVSNLPYLLPWIEELVLLESFEVLTIITNARIATNHLRANASESILRSFTKLKIIDWNSISLNQLVSEVDVCIIPAGIADPRKEAVSDNRLTTAITLGLPTIASPINSYLKWSDGCVLSHHLCDGIRVLKKRANSLIEGLRRTQFRIQQQRSPDIISDRLISALKHHHQKLLHSTSTCENFSSQQEPMTSLCVEKFYTAKGHLKGGRIQDAISIFSELTQSYPLNREAHYLLGLGYFSAKSYQEARMSLIIAEQQDPTDERVIITLALTEEKLGKISLAKSRLLRHLELESNSFAVNLNLGAILLREDKPSDAIAYLAKAAELNPRSKAALNNRGECNLKLDRPDLALPDFDSLNSEDPSNIYFSFKLATTLLKLGQYSRGLPLYESRLCLNQAKTRGYTATRWNGSDCIINRTLLVYAEQGFGDTIQYVRFLRDLKRLKNPIIIFQVPFQLVSLLRHIQGIDRVISFNEDPGPVDFAVPLLSIPYLIGLDQSYIVSPQKYLFPAPVVCLQWQRMLRERTKIGAIRIGICWQGGRHIHHLTSMATDKTRSLQLRTLTFLKSIDNVNLISLQDDPLTLLDPGTQESAKELGIIQFQKELSDFEQTAGLLANIDLTITVDTAVAHLSGALGRPTIVIHRKDSCWRWGWGQFKPKWYDDMVHYKSVDALKRDIVNYVCR
jgi:tetratricopeptide (TPR) repeat protein